MKGFQFDNLSDWSVKELRDQIALMAGNQARTALQAIREGKSLQEAVEIGYTFPPRKD